MYIYQIVASCTKYFNIVASGIFVLFQQCDEEYIRERDFHFQSPISFFYLLLQIGLDTLNCVVLESE